MGSENVEIMNGWIVSSENTPEVTDSLSFHGSGKIHRKKKRKKDKNSKINEFLVPEEAPQNSFDVISLIDNATHYKKGKSKKNRKIEEELDVAITFDRIPELQAIQSDIDLAVEQKVKKKKNKYLDATKSLSSLDTPKNYLHNTFLLDGNHKKKKSTEVEKGNVSGMDELEKIPQSKNLLLDKDMTGVKEKKQKKHKCLKSNAIVYSLESSQYSDDSISIIDSCIHQKKERKRNEGRNRNQELEMASSLQGIAELEGSSEFENAVSNKNEEKKKENKYWENNKFQNQFEVPQNSSDTALNFDNIRHKGKKQKVMGNENMGKNADQELEMAFTLKKMCEPFDVFSDNCTARIEKKKKKHLKNNKFLNSLEVPQNLLDADLVFKSSTTHKKKKQKLVESENMVKNADGELKILSTSESISEMLDVPSDCDIARISKKKRKKHLESDKFLNPLEVTQNLLDTDLAFDKSTPKKKKQKYVGNESIVINDDEELKILSTSESTSEMLNVPSDQDIARISKKKKKHRERNEFPNALEVPQNSFDSVLMLDNNTHEEKKQKIENVNKEITAISGTKLKHEDMLSDTDITRISGKRKKKKDKHLVLSESPVPLKVSQYSFDMVRNLEGTAYHKKQKNVDDLNEELGSSIYTSDMVNAFSDEKNTESCFKSKNRRQSSSTKIESSFENEDGKCLEDFREFSKNENESLPLSESDASSKKKKKHNRTEDVNITEKMDDSLSSQLPYEEMDFNLHKKANETYKRKKRKEKLMAVDKNNEQHTQIKRNNNTLKFEYIKSTKDKDLQSIGEVSHLFSKPVKDSSSKKVQNSNEDPSNQVLRELKENSAIFENDSSQHLIAKTKLSPKSQLNKEKAEKNYDASPNKNATRVLKTADSHLHSDITDQIFKNIECLNSDQYTLLTQKRKRHKKTKLHPSPESHPAKEVIHLGNSPSSSPPQEFNSTTLIDNNANKKKGDEKYSDDSSIDEEITNSNLPSSFKITDLDINEDPVNFEIPELHAHESVALKSENKQFFESKGIKMKFGKWSKSEDELLRRNYNDFCVRYKVNDPHILLGLGQHRKNPQVTKFLKAKHFYVRLGKDLVDRPLRNIYLRARLIFHPLRNESKCSRKDVSALNDALNIIGNKWHQIGSLVDKSGFTLHEVHRWNAKPINKGRWSTEEREQLIKALETVAKTKDLSAERLKGISWNAVSKLVPTRNFSQCRLYWGEHLAWASDVEEMLPWHIESVAKLIWILKTKHVVKDEAEINWREIHKTYFKQVAPSYIYLQKKWRILKRECADSVRQMGYCDMIKFLCKKYKKQVSIIEETMN